MSRSTRYVGLLVGALLMAMVPVLTGLAAQAHATAAPAEPATAGPHLSARTLSVAAPWASPARPTLGQRFVIGGRMPGHVRRPVVLIIDGTRRASGRTDRRGRYRFAVRAPGRVTTLRIMVRAPRLRRHRAAVTAIRLVPVVIQVQACTALPAGTTTWKAGSKRIVTCLLAVPVGSTLRIAAGATAYFGPGAGIVVKGSLVIAGTADAPARLRAATARRWTGVATGGDGSVAVAHAVFSDAQTAIDGESTATNPRGHINVVDSRFSRCGTGVVVQSSVSTVWTLHASVTGSEFGQVVRGVWITRAIDPVVANNSFHGVSGAPVTITWSRLALGRVHGNSGYDNAENIWVLGQILVSADGTFVGGRADQTPGTKATPRPLMPVLDLGALLVGPGTTVTVAPGVVKARPNGALVVLGTLDIAGTVDRPVVLTAANDATVGDLTGPSSSTGSEDWYGIQVSDSGTSGSIAAWHLDLRHSALGIAQLSPSGGSSASLTLRSRRTG